MINKITLLGRVGKDPETRQAGENKVTNFTLATTEKYKDKEDTQWHNIVIWGALSDIAEKYVKKGDLLYVEGKSTNRSWEDKDGNKRYTTEVVVRELKLMPKGQGNKAEQSAPAPQSESDALPF